MPGIELEPIEFGGTLDPVISALITQLVLRGALKPEDLNEIALKLDAEGEEDDADSVRTLMLDVAIEREHLASRSGSDGGSEPD